MDLNRVSVFARVVQEGSITAAARGLGVPKSSVSRSVSQLEDALGVRLLHRTTRKIHVTDAGAAFYERVARAIAEIDEATALVQGAQTDPRGTVRLTAPVDFGVWALAPILARFARRHPRILVDVSLTNRVTDVVAEGFDLAVRAGTVTDASLIARRVGMLGGGLYASVRYAARRGVPASLEELAGHACVLFRPTHGRGSWSLVSAGGEARSVEVRGAIGVDDMSFVKKAVLAGAGIGLVPEFLCAREEHAGKMLRVLPEWSFAGSELSVVYPSARLVPLRVAALRDFLVEGLGGVVRRCAEARG